MISCPQWFENLITIQTVTPQEDTYCTVCHRLLLSFLLQMEIIKLKILLFKNSHRLWNTQNILANRLLRQQLHSRGSDPSSQHVKKQMEKTTLIRLGLFPHNDAQSQWGHVDFAKGWAEWDINYSKGLVLTLRDSSTGSPWSPGSCSLPLSATTTSTLLSKKSWYFQGQCGSRTLKTVQMAFPPLPSLRRKSCQVFFQLGNSGWRGF